PARRYGAGRPQSARRGERGACLLPRRAGAGIPPRARGAGPLSAFGGRPPPAAMVGTALTLFYAGRAQAGRGQGIYFYLPKVESAEEVAWYRDFFDASRRHLPSLADAIIRGIPLGVCLSA